MRQKLKTIGRLATPSLKTYIVATSLVLISCLTVTWWTWNNARKNLTKDIQTTLDGGTSNARDIITNTINTYSAVLNGAAGLFKAMDTVDSDAWQRYVSNLGLEDRYPGLQSLVYCDVVSPLDIDEYLTARTTERAAAYSLRPMGTRDVYVPVRFIEPATTANTSVIGFDPYTEPTRRKAMDSARDSGKPSITSRIILAADQTDTNPGPGFIIWIPVYSKNAPLNTVGERRAALTGFVSAGVRSHELIEGLFGKTLTQDTALQVFDGTQQSPENLIYKSEGYQNLVKQAGVTTSRRTIDIGNNTWTLAGYVNRNIASEAERNQPSIILASGVLLSFMLSGTLLYVMITRARSISEEKNREVQEAKDSLISLASHQLRTPATGVKQFLGMVLEGYAGKLTKEQYRMLEKANQSNERQLEIINQILHVTRADSGRLVLHKKRVELTHIIRTVIEEHALPVKQRSQRVLFNRQSKKIYIQADQQYLTMALDNLLSNASKYSHAKTTIRIGVEEQGRSVIITIADHGVGIHADDLHRLFQKFSRIDNELSVEAGGNGIGLYLCREIIELHHGTVHVDSEPGKGSRFIIELPKGLGRRRS